MTKQEKLEACDEVLSVVREAWMDSEGDKKQTHYSKINDLLDRRLKIMNEPEPAQPK